METNSRTEKSRSRGEHLALDEFPGAPRRLNEPIQYASLAGKRRWHLLFDSFGWQEWENYGGAGQCQCSRRSVKLNANFGYRSLPPRLKIPAAGTRL